MYIMENTAVCWSDAMKRSILRLLAAIAFAIALSLITRPAL
jgi:hypothetical protein